MFNPTAAAEPRAEIHFPDHKPRFTRAQAITEANRCLYCHDAPCVQACPTEIDIPEFIRRIATDNVRGAARTIFEANILGMSCARVCPVEVLCVGRCVYQHEDMPPVQIGRLQRYATDIAYDRGWRFFTPGAASGRRVALVGAGPASLACAHELRRLGHAVTIYEKRSLPGGLNTTGVAPYKMGAEPALREVAWVTEGMDIPIRTGVEVGRDIAWQDLVDEHDAVFLGAGLGPDSRLGVPGEELQGVWGGVQFVEAMKCGQDLGLDGVRQAIVIGGGNTSIDVVRELRELHVPEVRLSYRRGEAQMPGYAHEWAWARQEGVEGLFWRSPVALHGEGGRVVAIEFATMEAVGGEGRGQRLSEVPGGRHRVPAQLVIVATGQGRLEEALAPLSLQWSQGRPVTDDDGRTTHSKVWAGGDLRNGGKEVVNAAAEGKRAARSMHAVWGGV
jgi:glutamate synthase (NADPH/NADH) small chain